MFILTPIKLFLNLFDLIKIKNSIILHSNNRRFNIMKTTWLSPAKINLFLYITGIRKDGYHNIQTLFQLLNYGDIIYIIPNNSGNIKLLTHTPYIPHSKNIIIHAAKLLKKKHKN